MASRSANSNKKQNDKPGPKKGPNWWRVFLFGAPVTGAVILFGAGILFWGGFNTAMEATNTLGFCISCHEMKDNVYREYKHTIHYQNRTGVRASCSDCHVPDPWVHKFVRKVEASRELVHKVLGTIDTPEKFNAKRLQLAKKVWQDMKSTDSRECRNCHNLESMAPEFQRPRARTQHFNALRTGQTCIDCHKGIAHKNVRNLLSEEELEKLEKPNPAFVRAVPEMYMESLKRIEAKEKIAAQKKQERETAAEAQVVKRIKSAVIAALAANKAERDSKNAVSPRQTKQADDKTANTSPRSGIDWSGVKAKTVTLFYPGQASFEWVQTGKDHGGARAFAKLGDRCASCHAKEVRDMGAKIVSGKKAEPTPIPGKRGHIDIKLQATHDDQKIYLRFQWPDAGHTPAPFVDGGKMDPKNQIKLAMMIAGKGVDKVDQAGCWATCHHDSREMPHHPDTTALQGSGDLGRRINIKQGITKYLAQSRTKVEIKGRRGKKRGGWSKLKPADEITGLIKSGAFMDLIRVRSGAAPESGHVLSERIMKDDAKIVGQSTLEGGIWTVVMSRPLVADAAADVSIKPGELYTVGFALHDDFTNARFHHVSLEFKLGLDNPDAEINVVKK